MSNKILQLRVHLNETTCDHNCADSNVSCEVKEKFDIKTNKLFNDQEFINQATNSIKFQLVLINKIIHQIEDLESRTRNLINRTVAEKSFNLNDSVRLKIKYFYDNLEIVQRNLVRANNARHDLHTWMDLKKIEDFQFRVPLTDAKILGTIEFVNEVVEMVTTMKKECDYYSKNVNSKVDDSNK